MIPPKTAKKFYFTCDKGHSFSSKVCHMVDSKTICPICTREKKSSIFQVAIFYYISRIYPDAKQNVTFDFLDRKEFDIYIPSINTAIEYDGQAWHKDKEKDLIKNKICEDNNISIYRIREPKCPKLNSTSIDIYTDGVHHKNLTPALRKLFDLMEIDCSFIIDVESDMSNILSLCSFYKKEGSLSNRIPELLKEWDYSKNVLNPEEIKPFSMKKAFWICDKGHSYEAIIAHKSSGERCPYCSGRKVIKGKNDLKTVYLEVVPYWNNGDNIEDYFSKSGKIVNWKCPKCSYEWKDKIINVVRHKDICPNCSNKKES